jgi:hypothetical protein
MEKSENRIPPPEDTPEREAWITAFFIENHLDYYVYQEQVANPEQVRFMVFAQEDGRYYPCSDRMYESIVNRNAAPFLKQAYGAVLKRILSLIDAEIEDIREKKYLESLVKIKFRHETRDYIMIPSRLEKRLIRIFLERTKIEDPWLGEKLARNLRMGRLLDSDTFKSALNNSGSLGFKTPPPSLSEIRSLIDHIELKRLIALSGDKRLWETDMAQQFTESDYLDLFKRGLKGDGIELLFEFIGIGSGAGKRSKNILWLADETGEIMVDLVIVQYLLKLGHKVIIAFKDGPFYSKAAITDVQKDPQLERMLEGAFFIDDKSFSKNELVRILRSDYDVIAISDGTREIQNLLLASTTFARLFKEVDGIISRGAEQKRRFFETNFQFTQDIYSICRDEDHSVRIDFKAKHADAVKFSHRDLESKAKSIIDKMATAKSAGMTVIFYSAIIGSIPGKIKTAKKLISVFVKHLKEQFADTFIINPAEYFEPGMDADDLMYMWEIVQKSGFINTWRFQTYEDIAKAFQIIGKKVPPEWVGKDATFSTGCTKEMNIALDVIKSHPEMQIIGPAGEKFMRRKEYGVGKMYDKRLGDSF